MANASFPKKSSPIEYDKFYGINEAVGETEIKPGEWVKGYNWRVTVNNKPQKRPGKHTFINFGAGNVQGLKEFEINSKHILLICWNGKVYEYDLDEETDTTAIADLITEGTVTELGTISDKKTSIFWFNEKIYFLNGTDYKQYDGSTYQDVVPYIPTVAIASPPSGGGTLFEEVNLLTGAKTVLFVGDGSTTEYHLPETDIDTDLVTCTVNDVVKTETVDFTVVRSTGIVTFTTAPANEAEVSLTWTKVESGNANLVKNHKYARDYGVGNDTNLFIFGNVNEKRVIRYSGINKANYFPVNSFVAVGSDEYAVTDLMPQYSSLVVFKEDSTKVIRPAPNAEYNDNTGLNPYDFPYYDLNEAVGNIAPNMVQLIDNNPISFFGYSFWQWASNTSVEDERNAQIVSDRLKLSLESLNLAGAVTHDYVNKKELWINISDIVYIWNYGNDTMYKYDNIQATEFIEIDGDIYYGGNGTVEHMSELFTDDNEDNILCKIYGGFTDSGSIAFRKVMTREWLQIASATRTGVEVGFLTDEINEEDIEWLEVSYSLFDFDDIDFDDFTFNTNRNPQTEYFKDRLKYVGLQWVLKNDTNDETCTVLKMLLNVNNAGYSR